MLDNDFILKMHYYPPEFAERGSPVDTFWIHVEPGEWISVAVETLIEACIDKYHLSRKKKRWAMWFDIQDCMWECVPRPDSVRLGRDGSYE